MTPSAMLPTDSISLCMIVKNEEACLERCLRSAFSVVDEIVIVDTGSSDRTVEMAKSFGARVFSLPWRDDFSEPRNLALEKARGSFCLHLDADEWIDEASLPCLGHAKSVKNAAGFHLTVLSDHGGYRSKSIQIRLFRRLDGVRYEGRVHEQIAPSLVQVAQREGLSLDSLKATIHHEGYLPEIIARKNKLEERRRQLLRQLEDHPARSLHPLQVHRTPRRGGLSRASAPGDKSPPKAKPTVPRRSSSHSQSSRAPLDAGAPPVRAGRP